MTTPTFSDHILTVERDGMTHVGYCDARLSICDVERKYLDYDMFDIRRSYLDGWRYERVHVSPFSYLDSEGVWQYVLTDIKTRDDICRGTYGEIEAVRISEIEHLPR